MKIKSVDVYATDLDLSGEHRSAHTRYTVTQDVFVRIVTDEGNCGYGSTAPKYYITGETQDTVIAVLKKRLIPAVIGQNPFDLEKIHDAMDHAIKGNTSAKAALDTAIYDLMGKVLNVPVYQLLGGAYRIEMPAFDLIGLWSPEEAAAKVEQRLAEGYREFKIKAGPDPAADLRRVEAVSKAAPGIPLKVDANQAWSTKQAVELTRKFGELGVSVIEQPVHMDNIEGLCMVRNACPQVEVMADESMKSLGDALRLIRSQAVDMFNIKLIKAGGIYPARKIAAVAESANMCCMAGGTIQNSLLDAATAHFLAATRNIIFNEIKSPQWIKNDIASGLKIVEGMVRVPDGPGLGMEIDEERLQACRVAG
ncbi:L-alanine-DL-glutamate epimerase [Desulfotomaculum arcticum]|uniref:Dipeptide epimerase n=1 Tax=Desulfotruncus arcticus DSM 17038 TaxID=1121424 RepID=A0A1I2PGE1_9FIRM|nr:dipeptide epimerase [Desulfotruncus arcticus]SFG14610.1 L-alanine-DL-glutamate epimerase [Desulfotomaculum arcticum] [Desulfotruncus arcticus DSM 17038]